MSNQRAWQRRFHVLVVALTLVHWAPSPADGQTPGVGTVEAALLLRQMDGEKRVLMIGAHPDDEDTSMLSALARGTGATTAYLSLSRGEGGQNLIGSELTEGLGLLRTGELVAARTIDGGRQYFTRAFDFGYSKSVDETFGHWPEEDLVRDVTWVVRTFRPHVILAVFTGTPRDGHGQHQAAGIAARRAFEVAGDASAFPDQMELGVEPWTVSKLYQLNRFGRGSPTLEVQTGTLDPLLGRSYYQVAMDSRSQHRSQDMGSGQAAGTRTSGATLVESRVELPRGGDTGIFAGVDTSLAAVAAAAAGRDEAGLIANIARYREALAVATELMHPVEPSRSVPALRDAIVELTEAQALAEGAPPGPERTELIRVLDARLETVTRAILAAAGIVVDVRVERQLVVPGERVAVEVTVWNGGSRDVAVSAVGLLLPEDWREAATQTQPTELGAGELRVWRFSVEIPESAEISRPYFLEEDRDGLLYRWPIDPSVMGLPGAAALVSGRVTLTVDGSLPLELQRSGDHVVVDQANGEYRVPVFVVPPLSVTIEPRTTPWPVGESAPRSVAVGVTTYSQSPLEGQVRLSAPSGWEVTPASIPLSSGVGGAEDSFSFEVTPGVGAPEGPTTLRAVVTSNGREYSEGIEFVDYDHIEPALLTRQAELEVTRLQVDLPPGLRVGYVMGTGDSGPEALADLGFQVQLLEPEDVRSGDLDEFDTILLGVRAYEARDDLRSSNERLLDFARRGGTVIVQYNQYQYPAGNFAPERVEIARPHDRITDETAEVHFLSPEHPILNVPNRISSEDFRGWVQERGLYFLSDWDEAYTPLLEMSDPGERPKQGSLLVTRLGDGAYVYTGLALFRQLPAGVPGAFRLLANLVAIRGSDLAPIY